MAKFKVGPTVGGEAETFRVGSKAAPLVDADKGKAVTLAAGSEVDLAAADDEIFGFLSSIEDGTQDGFKIGGVITDGYALVNTGTAAVGDLVVVASNPSAGTSGLTTVKTITPVAGTTLPPVHQWQVVDTGVIRRV